MNTSRILIAVGAALALGTLISPVVLHAQESLALPQGVFARKKASTNDELRIMTKILEASIEKDTIDRRVQQSVFDSRIRFEYIPTVGAIFTIPITFPLHPSQSEKGDASEEVVDVDLWEHFSSASENGSRVAAQAVPPIEPPDTVNIEINLDKEGLDEQLVRLYEDVERSRAKTFVHAVQDIRLYRLDGGFSWELTIGNSKPYDPVKVSTLTRSIIETIAQYGHRLESMPNSERVLVVLEAPRPLASSTVVRFGKPTPETRAREIVKEVENVVGRELDKLRVRSDRSRSIRVRGTLFKSSISRRGEHDRRLLAFKKSDLQQERSYDSIKSKVETTDY